MAKTKSTKRALLMSALALLACISMLIGSTFAWFTDSVTSGNNVIRSGKLDVEMEYWNGTTWTPVTEQVNLFEDDALWEPGYTDVVYLKISNKGNLALKYQLGVNVISEVGSINKDGDEFLLSDYIEFGVVESDGQTIYGTREEARNAITDSKIISKGYAKSSELKNTNDAEYVTLVVYMPETTGNEANYKEGAAVPTIKLGVNLFATQLAHESDSFNNQYDLKAWDEAAKDYETSEDGSVIYINNAPQLVQLALDIQSGGTSFRNKTISIGADIDLSDTSWTPINAWSAERPGTITINGNGNTISGMTVNGGSKAGFISQFAGGSLVINDLIFEDAQVTTTGSYAGVVVGYQYGNVTMNNVDVIDSTVRSTATSGTCLGGLVGFSVQNDGAKLTLDGCDVTATSISGYHSLGGFVGTTKVTEAQNTLTINNCTSSAKILYTATGGVGGHYYASGANGYADAEFTGSGNDVSGSTITKITVASNKEEFASAVNNGGSVVLKDDIAVDDGTAVTKAANIDFGGYSLTRETASGKPFSISTTEAVVLENAVFETVKGNAVLETRTNGANVTVNDSTFNCLANPSTGNVGVQVYAQNVTFTFNNCTFNNMPIITNSSYKEGIKLVFNNCTFNWNGDNCPGLIQLANYVEADVDLNDCKFAYTTDSQYTTQKVFVSYNWPGTSTVDFNGFEVIGTRNNDKIWKICSSNNAVTVNATGELSYTFNGEAVDFNQYLK